MRPERQHLSSGRPLDHALVVGYVPLLSAAPGQVVGVDDPEALRVLAGAQRCPSGQADACLWVADGEGLSLVLALDQADAIAAHLLTWSGGRVDERFALCVAERGGRFLAALVPNMASLIERFEAAVPAARRASGFDVLLRPLFFVSTANHAFGQFGRLLTGSTRLGLIDTAALATAHPPSAALRRVREVGTVAVCRDARPFGHDIGPLLGHLFDWVAGPGRE